MTVVDRMCSLFDFCYYSARESLCIPEMSIEKLAELFPKELGHLAGNHMLGIRLQIEGL